MWKTNENLYFSVDIFIKIIALCMSNELQSTEMKWNFRAL
jgi:hypothetical protein